MFPTEPFLVNPPGTEALRIPILKTLLLSIKVKSEVGLVLSIWFLRVCIHFILAHVRAFCAWQVVLKRICH